MFAALVSLLLADIDPFVSGPAPVHVGLSAATPKRVSEFFSQLKWNANGTELMVIVGDTVDVDDVSGMGGNCTVEEGVVKQKGTRLTGTALETCLSGDGKSSAEPSARSSTSRFAPSRRTW